MADLDQREKIGDYNGHCDKLIARMQMKKDATLNMIVG
jgi:hypothetical protein